MTNLNKTVLRIGFDAKRAFENASGLGVYSRTLICSIMKHRPQWMFFLYTPDANAAFAEELNPLGGHIISAPSKTMKALWRSFSMIKNLTSNQIDLFHGLSGELPYGIHQISTKSIVTVHDVIYKRFPMQYPWFDRVVYHLKTRYACRAATKVIAISESTKKDIIQYYDVDPDKVHVVYQAVDRRYTEPSNVHQEAVWLKKHHFPEKYILSVGSFTERKNQLSLVRAFDKISDKTDCDLILVGRGDRYKSRIQKFLKNSRIVERVRFIENLPSSDLPAIYRNASLFVYPSLYEGFGLPIAEAMHCSVPVITSNGSCFRETGGPDSIYVDPLNVFDLGKHILRVLQDGSLQKKMAANGFSFVKKFNSENYLSTLCTLYENILGNGN